MNSSFKKTVALLLCVIILCSMCACGGKETEAESETTQVVQPIYNQMASSVKKTETVFVNLDSTGKVLKTTVSDWLHVPQGEVQVKDISDLKNITNTKGTVEPVKDGDNILWNMESTDLYYSGETDKALPAGVSVRYYLNGVEKSAQEMAGVSGDVKLEITLRNDCHQKQTVDGKEVDIYLPMLMAGGTVFPEDIFEDIQVENGITVGDGSKEIVLALGVPGMAESLGLDQELIKELLGKNLSDTCTITAKTDCFSLTNLYFVALPLCNMDLDLTIPDDAKDLQGSLNTVKKLIESIESMGVDNLLKVLRGDTNQIVQLAKAAKDAAKIVEENKALLSLAEKYMTKENMDTIESAMKTLNDPSVNQAMEMLSNPIVKAFLGDLPNITGDLEKIAPLLGNLQKDLSDPAVQKSLQNLPKTMEKLKDLQSVMANNQDLFKLLGQLSDESSLSAIQEVVGTLSDVDLDTLLKKYDGVAKDAEGIAKRGELWISYGKEYRIFTAATAQTQTGMLMFVYNLPSIASHPQAQTAQSNEVSEPWYKRIFNK